MADHVHNPSYPCGCTVEFNGKAAAIRYCRMHGAAPRLMWACQAARSDLNGIMPPELVVRFGATRVLVGNALEEAGLA